MKLLLTSGGIRNKSIAKALRDLVDKPASETKVAMIPTAVNPEGGNKDWFIGQFLNLWRYGFSWIDVVDPSAAGFEWQPRLAEVDVVFVSGGNTFHLLDQARKSGFDAWIKENKNSFVYVGSSAGSLLATPTIAAAGIENGDRNLPKLKDLKGLDLVPFEFMPHVGTFINMESVEGYAKKTTNPIYAADDETAIKVIDNKVEVISEGTWKLFD